MENNYEFPIIDLHNGNSVRGCAKSFTNNGNSNIQINGSAIPVYKERLKKNLKDLFMQPGIITEHAVFDVIDRTD